jgi:AraC family transcriptional regulator
MHSEIELPVILGIPVAAQKYLTRLLTDALFHLPSNHERTQINLRQAIDMVQGPLPAPRRTGGLASWQVRRVEIFVDENIESAVCVQRAAEVTRISVSHFSRAFKASFDQSFTQYVITKRIALARDLLRDTDRSIADIAIGCGLSDQSHLTRLFRKQYGLPPSAWRRANCPRRLAA